MIVRKDQFRITGIPDLEIAHLLIDVEVDHLAGGEYQPIVSFPVGHEGFTVPHGLFKTLEQAVEHGRVSTQRYLRKKYDSINIKVFLAPITETWPPTADGTH